MSNPHHEDEGRPISWGELRTTLHRLTKIESEGHRLVAAQFDTITREIGKINSKLDANTQLLRGSDDSDNPGLMTRVAILEHELRSQERQIGTLKGYALMLGCGIIASLGGLAISLITQFLGKP